VQIPRANILGVRLHAMDLAMAVEAIVQALSRREKGYVCVSGVHGVSEAQKDLSFRRLLNRAFLNTMDGMPLVWLAKLQFKGRVERVYGPDLMLALLSVTQRQRWRHFFYGGMPGVAEDLQTKMFRRFPGIITVGAYCPPFRPLDKIEDTTLVKLIAERQPDVMWIGLSTPKQERFMAEYLTRLDTTIMIGVGAAFDFHTGRVRQAPRWIQSSGLEWLFRMGQEPRRLAARYMINNPLFIWRIATQLLRLRSGGDDS